MLHQLPAEIALQIISRLPLYSLYSTTLVSHDWNALVTANEPSVYRNAALLHRFIDEDQLASGADSIITDWKAYCRRQLEIERGWRGKGPSFVQELTATPMVHRIKVDYEFDFVITTSQIGGLFVCDIKTDRILWALPPSHVSLYVHAEYDRGYVVFNRYDNCKEVWRHTIDVDSDHHSETSPPDKKMLDISTQAMARFNSTRSRRGHFIAWALLRMPEECRWFRVSYPNLLAVATDNAYAWDIPTMQLVSDIHNLQRRHQGFRLAATSYAEVNDLYAFICGEGGLRIFSRKGGTLLYQLPSRDLSGAVWDVRPQIRSSASSVVHPQTLRYNKQSSSSSHGAFMACHVSASGKDLAILTTNSRVILLPNFQRLFTGSKTVRPRDIAIILNFQPASSEEYTSLYLAVGSRNGKLAVALQNGIYVISPDFDFIRLTAGRPPRSVASVCRLSQFDNEQSLSSVSCLQITHDAIYVTYRPSERGMPVGLNTVHMVHF